MTKPRILLSIAETDDAFASMVKALSPHAEVIVAGLEDYSLKGVDAFVGKKTDAAKLAEADRLKAVFAYKTGVDDFPVRELGERGILLVNSHVNSRYIAEYAFGLAIALVSRIAEFDRKMRQGDWDIEDPYWKSLFAMKAGLVGFGHIGRELHALLAANGIPTMTIDRGKDYPDGVELVPSLEELCRKADILFLSLPRTSATNGMFGKEIHLARKSEKAGRSAHPLRSSLPGTRQHPALLAQSDAAHRRALTLCRGHHGAHPALAGRQTDGQRSGLLQRLLKCRRIRSRK